MSIARRLGQLVEVPSLDPDQSRRSRLLNILLAGSLLIALNGMLAVTLGWGIYGAEMVRDAYVAGVLTVACVVVVYALNRYVSGWLASALFLLMLNVILAFVDEPLQVAAGRSSIAFAFPIVMASVLLPPTTSTVAVHAGMPPDVLVVFTFLAIGLGAWLASSTLQRALRDLRILNRELDQRVTERTRDLAEALAKNQAILDSTADGVIVFDQENKAIVANPAIAGLLGRPVHRITDRTIETLMGEDVDSADRENIIQLMADHESAHSGVQFRWGKKTFAASLAPVRDNTGHVAGTVAVFRDFTREAETDRVKSAFISIASHELRTPLSAILGYADMLQAGVYGQLTDRQRSTIGRVVANTGQLLELANNLLDRAQIEAGRLILRFGTFSPHELIRNTQGVMDVMAQAKGLKLTSHIADNMPATLTGDRQRLHQILVNLTGNAIKFTQTGSVSIRVYMHDADHWALAVTDTGPGISQDAQGYVFEAFRQADESITREYGGAGLGLSIVKELVTLMGGDITLESKVGQGSTFTVIMPITPPASPTEQTQEGAR
jgi:PAS domain S-box-containing protein